MENYDQWPIFFLNLVSSCVPFFHFLPQRPDLDFEGSCDCEMVRNG